MLDFFAELPRRAALAIIDKNESLVLRRELAARGGAAQSDPRTASRFIASGHLVFSRVIGENAEVGKDLALILEKLDGANQWLRGDLLDKTLATFPGKFPVALARLAFRLCREDESQIEKCLKTVLRGLPEVAAKEGALNQAYEVARLAFRGCGGNRKMLFSYIGYGVHAMIRVWRHNEDAALCVAGFLQDACGDDLGLMCHLAKRILISLRGVDPDDYRTTWLLLRTARQIAAGNKGPRKIINTHPRAKRPARRKSKKTLGSHLKPRPI